MKIILMVFIAFVSLTTAFCQAKEDYVESGDSMYLLEDYRGAIADYSKAIELDPNYARAYQARGASKAELSDHRGAIVDITMMINLKPNESLERGSVFENAYGLRGTSKYLLEDYRGAIADFTKSVKHNQYDLTDCPPKCSRFRPLKLILILLGSIIIGGVQSLYSKTIKEQWLITLRRLNLTLIMRRPIMLEGG